VFTGLAGVLAVWLAKLEADARLSERAYLLPFLAFAGLAGLGLLLLSIAGLSRRGTRAARLEDLRRRGRWLDRRRDWRRRLGLHKGNDAILEAAWQMNEASKWTLRVEDELENLAPEFLPEWRDRTGPLELETDAKMSERLRVLDGIIQRVRARDGG
jgi:hypothetical protein